MNFTEAIVLAVEKVKAWIQSGGVKWDHVSDKPFVKVGGDTLTWDGNTEGLDNLLGFELPYYKVSDVVISASDVAEGFSLTLNDGSQCNFAPGESVGDLEGLGVMLTDYVASFSEADAAMAGFSAGTYFICADEIFVRSLTIPGYTGFAKEQIDPKVLPEALQFGKTTVQGDTLEWDGNTEGLEIASTPMGDYYKISDVALNVTDFSNGYSYGISGGEAPEMKATDGETAQTEVSNGVLGSIAGGYILVAFQDNIDPLGDGSVVLNKGIYVAYGGENGNLYPSSLTIPGYSGFTKTEIKPIKPEYLPGAVMLYPDAENYLYADSDTSDTSKRITKAQLQAFVKSGRTIYIVGIGDYAGGYLPATVIFEFMEVSTTAGIYTTAEYTA